VLQLARSSNTGASDKLGSAQAVSGDGLTLVVTSPYEDSNATGINGNQAAYVIR
jgi:hypothetical protein